jgi:hypothetical protein
VVVREGGDIPIFIRFVEVLVVDELEVLHPKVSKLLSDVGAKTPAPHHDDSSGPQAILSVTSKEANVSR